MKSTLFFSLFLVVFFIGNNSLSAQIKKNISKDVQSLISKKRSFNKEFGYGYRIQIYYGDETNARSLQKKFQINFPGIYTKLTYQQPNWKVQVGNYKTKLEAEKALITFSEKFSGLIVIPLGK